MADGRLTAGVSQPKNLKGNEGWVSSRMTVHQCDQVLLLLTYLQPKNYY